MCLERHSGFFEENELLGVRVEMEPGLVAQAVLGRDGGFDYGGGNASKKQEWIQDSGRRSDTSKT